MSRRATAFTNSRVIAQLCYAVLSKLAERFEGQLPFKAAGRGFESLQGRHYIKKPHQNYRLRKSV